VTLVAYFQHSLVLSRLCSVPITTGKCQTTLKTFHSKPIPCIPSKFHATLVIYLQYTFTGTHSTVTQYVINPLNAELNPICHLLALLGAHHIFHVSRIRVNTSILHLQHTVSNTQVFYLHHPMSLKTQIFKHNMPLTHKSYL
jgi:hypothetical protein